MTLDQIKLFRDIAHTRSVSRGASANGVSQSAASQHFQELERLLEVELLDRSTRPLGLTEAGRLYFEFCRDVLRRQQEFEDALNRLKGRVEGTVRVAAIYSVGILDMSRLEAGTVAADAGGASCRWSTCARRRFTTRCSPTRRTWAW